MEFSFWVECVSIHRCFQSSEDRKDKAQLMSNRKGDGVEIWSNMVMNKKATHYLFHTKKNLTDWVSKSWLFIHSLNLTQQGWPMKIEIWLGTHHLLNSNKMIVLNFCNMQIH